MSRSKHSETQIIAALKQVEAGRTVEDVACEVGVSAATIYAWKAKFGGMDASEAQRLRSLEAENSRLKRLVARFCGQGFVDRRRFCGRFCGQRFCEGFVDRRTGCRR
jgi:putative transposase